MTLEEKLDAIAADLRIIGKLLLNDKQDKAANATLIAVIAVSEAAKIISEEDAELIEFTDGTGRRSE